MKGALSILLATALSALASPILRLRAGPSGTVVEPVNGLRVAKGEAFAVDYRPVNFDGTQPGYFTNWVSVEAIQGDTSLFIQTIPPFYSPHGQILPMYGGANLYENEYSAEQWNQSFACGDWTIRFVEMQTGEFTGAFVSAQPTVHFEC